MRQPSRAAIPAPVSKLSLTFVERQYGGSLYRVNVGEMALAKLSLMRRPANEFGAQVTVREVYVSRFGN